MNGRERHGAGSGSTVTTGVRRSSERTSRTSASSVEPRAGGAPAEPGAAAWDVPVPARSAEGQALRNVRPALAGVDEEAMPSRHDLAPVTVDRLLRVYDLCTELKAEGRRLVLSLEIAGRVGAGASQIRRDLSRLGRLGTRGSGYRVDELTAILERFLGRNVPRDMVLVGAGSLCAVLLGRGIPERPGLRFAAVFDTNPHMVGARCGGLVVRSIGEIPEVLGTLDAEVAVLAVPAAEAQHVADLLAQNGIRAILNLTPVALPPERGVVVRDVDLSLELENLVFDASCQPRAGGRRSARGPAH
jgi:redox-sensing transcriptional repressor